MTSSSQPARASGEELDTSHLGTITWDSNCELFLPAGLPGFESERRMVPVEIPAQRPLVFLQSATQPEICFVALPVRTICSDYQLHLTEEERATLEFNPERMPEIGTDALCLALLLPAAGNVEVNLNSPLVINLHNSRCLQALSPPSATRRYRLGDDGEWECLC